MQPVKNPEESRSPHHLRRSSAGPRDEAPCQKQKQGDVKIAVLAIEPMFIDRAFPRYG
jgi:hypothetical protein